MTQISFEHTLYITHFHQFPDTSCCLFLILSFFLNYFLRYLPFIQVYFFHAIKLIKTQKSLNFTLRTPRPGAISPAKRTTFSSYATDSVQLSNLIKKQIIWRKKKEKKNRSDVPTQMSHKDSVFVGEERRGRGLCACSDRQVPRNACHIQLNHVDIIACLRYIAIGSALKHDNSRVL